MGIVHLENFFVAGILHDIGKLFFFEFAEEDYARTLAMVDEKDCFIREAELEVLGMDHALAGSMVADQWRLPEPIRNAIHYHHFGTVGGEPDLILASVHLGDILARANILSKIDQYQKNIGFGQSWLNATESSLQGISDLIVRGKEIANQMATGSYSADQRTNAANEVQTLLDQLRALGNTQFNDRYLFSGYQEQSPAYDQNFNYLGDTKDIEIPIGESVQTDNCWL